jgi:hypothetical protein
MLTSYRRHVPTCPHKGRQFRTRNAKRVAKLGGREHTRATKEKGFT